ncbi:MULTISPECIES: hypothetical protein [Haloferax]|uniref:DUF2079 domain-containing protein n=2 Tax=Haloferax TaxID=2251 RepID=A0A6G1Z617_9EURY|nr:MULTISPECIES: hypothetical protein [Haloferax]KAB1185431.1 hypothetical protein Hfx1149_15365 [Haloferax sp. CBA1149]MRW82077.1 hypothetical protein [Haloferax marinisediminis]
MNDEPRTGADARRRIREVSAALALPGAYFTALSLLVFYPLLKPGFILTLDMIFAPNADYLQFGLHTKGPLYYGRLPFLLVLDGLALFLDDWLIQKLLLVSLPAVCGLAMYTACESRTRIAALFAGTLYAINPFVYVRLLAGHWYFLWGYAFVPLAVVAFDRYVDSGTDRALVRAVGWTTIVSVFDPHATVLVAVAGGCLWAVRAVPTVWKESGGTSNAELRGYVRRFGSFCLAAAAVNAYWLFPSAVTTVGGETQLSVISGADLTVFSASGTIAGNVPLSVAMLYGFWRGGATTALDVLPTWSVGLLFASLVYVAVYGTLHRWTDSRVRGLVLVGVVGFVLSLGVSTAVSEPLVRTLFDFVPILRGMRDTQKFAGLVVLAYALLGARGVDEFVTHRISRPATPLDTPQLTSLVLVFLLLVSPLVYTAPMFGGFGGQLDTTEYPESWHEANDLLGTDGSGRVLFLPWHQYLTFSWADRRLATPAVLFFDRTVIEGRNIEVGGIETRGSDPTRSRVREALTSPSDPEFGDKLASVGIEYVVLAHEADYRQYESLRSHSDFTVAFESEGLTVYENEVYEDRSAEWPRAGPPVPGRALGFGCLVSVGATCALVRRSVSER